MIGQLVPWRRAQAQALDVDCSSARPACICQSQCASFGALAVAGVAGRALRWVVPGFCGVFCGGSTGRAGWDVCAGRVYGVDGMTGPSCLFWVVSYCFGSFSCCFGESVALVSLEYSEIPG